MDWKFKDPQNVAVITSKSIIDGNNWIHYVTHDEDGRWQFHPYSGPTNEEEARVVALKK